MARVTVNLPDSVHKTVSEISDHTGDSISDVCLTLINKGFYASKMEPIEEKIIEDLGAIKDQISSGLGYKIEAIEKLVERAIYISLIAQKQVTDEATKDLSDQDFKAHQEKMKAYADKALSAQIRIALGG